MTRRQLLITYCTDCGQVLVRTKTGFVCPSGCGRIQPLKYDVRSGPHPMAMRIARTRRYTLAGQAQLAGSGVGAAAGRGAAAGLADRPLAGSADLVSAGGGAMKGSIHEFRDNEYAKRLDRSARRN